MTERTGKVDIYKKKKSFSFGLLSITFGCAFEQICVCVHTHGPSKLQNTQFFSPPSTTTRNNGKLGPVSVLTNIKRREV